jgi:ParB family chromosome partitioning protein
VSEAGWTTTTTNYFGRHQRPHRRARCVKKGDMAKEAERLVAGTHWLPELLRTPGLQDATSGDTTPEQSPDLDALAAFLTDAES